MDWWVYILRCGDGTLYTGSTNDVQRRLTRHEKGEGAKYTRGRGPLTLVYQEGCTDRSAALRREYEIKTYTKEQKMALIQRAKGHELRRSFTMNETRLLERFLRYVRCDSESGNEQKMCEMMGQELAELGLTVWRDHAGEQCNSNGWNVYARLEGEGAPMLFSAHTDTVSPGIGVEPVVEDGVIRSAGDTILGSDDKSGIAAVMEALATIVESDLPHRPVEVIFSICEEVGLCGAKYADYSQFTSKQCLVLDSSSRNTIVNRSPAHMTMHFAIAGKSSHAGLTPELGRHALKAAAEAVTNIPCGHVGDHTVMNVSNFLSPGKTNVVAATATFDMEIRSFEESILQTMMALSEDAVAAACTKYGTTYTVDTERSSNVAGASADSVLVQQIQGAFAKEGVDVAVKGTFGGCDATWINQAGILAVNMGTGMSKTHNIEESIAVADLNQTARVVLRLMTEFS